jgi:hypothetical protein
VLWRRPRKPTTRGGILAGAVGTWFVEWRRWKHEDQIRWHPDRRQAYVRFLKAADDYSIAGTQYAIAVGIIAAGGEGADEVNEAHEEMKRKTNALRPEEWEIELVAGPEVRAAAAHVVQLATQRARAEIEEERKRDIDASVVAAADKAAEEASAAIEEFKRAARAEIGLGQ